VTTGTAERPDTRPDPRIAERRQRVSADRRFRLRRRIAAALVVASLVGLTWYVANSPVVDVDEVVINGVDDPARRAEVLAASGITLGDPLLFVSLDGTAAAVEQVPWVDTVRVTRSWNPGVVEVSVTNREAIGVVADGEGVGDGFGVAVPVGLGFAFLINIFFQHLVFMKYDVQHVRCSNLGFVKL
jgi:cell division septal protein FtsQ